MKKKIEVVRQRTTFHLLTPDNGDLSYELLVRASRALTDAEMRQVAGLLGYAWRASMAGESLGQPQRVGKKTFVVSADVTKSRRDDVGDGWFEFLGQVPAIIQHGSPVRTTDRAGIGTKGTRLLEPVPDLQVTLYADSVLL